MIKYCLKRILLLIPMILVVSFLVYFIVDLSPTDPVYAIASPEATEEEVDALRESLGMNDPLIVRYGRYLWGLLHGDMGTSIVTRSSVWKEYTNRLPYTLKLAGCSILIALVVGMTSGIIAAVKENTLIDTGMSLIALLGASIPTFWLGMLLSLLFALELGWFPSFGGDLPLSWVLPSITLGFTYSAQIMRTTRSAMLDVIRQDYLRTARAKGVKEKTVILRHALKNALIPVLTVTGSTLGALIGGAMVVETVFSWPGVGSYIVFSMINADNNAVTGCVIMTTVLVSVILMVIDILYAFVDPRVKMKYLKK